MIRLVGDTAVTFLDGVMNLVKNGRIWDLDSYFTEDGGVVTTFRAGSVGSVASFMLNETRLGLAAKGLPVGRGEDSSVEIIVDPKTPLEDPVRSRLDDVKTLLFGELDRGVKREVQAISDIFARL